MFLGKPLNLWAGLLSAISSTALVLIVTVKPDIDPVQAATVIGSLTTFLGVLIAFLAGQPPVVNEGDKVIVQTPAGDPNRTITA